MRLIIVIIFNLIFFQLHAQFVIKGSVQQAKNANPIESALISIPDLKRGILSDSSGAFEMNKIPAGNYLLSVHYPGYDGIGINIALHSDTFLQIKLIESIAELHEIVVTGISNASEQHKNPLPINIISKLSLIENNSGNIMDVASKIPGVNILSTGNAISKPVIRGLSHNRVLSLYNGVRQEGQQWGDEHGIEIDPFSIQRIEVIKGPGTLAYGSDALGGVIHFISDELLPENTSKNEWTQFIQSNNHSLASSYMHAFNKNNWNGLFRVSAQQAANYYNAKDGYVYNSGFASYHTNGNIGIQKKWGYARIIFSSYYQQIGMTEGIRDSMSGEFLAFTNDTTAHRVSRQDNGNYRLDAPYQIVQHNRLMFQSRYSYRKQAFLLQLAYQLSERKEFGNYAQPNTYGLYFYMPTLNYDLKWILPAKSIGASQLGVNGMSQQNINKGSENIIPNYNILDAGIYWTHTYSRKTWTISGGLRMDFRNIHSEALYLDSNGNVASNGFLKFSANQYTFQNFSSSIGISKQIQIIHFLKLNIARAFRSPNAAELFSNGKHEGTNRYEMGNKLIPETNVQFDFSWESHYKHLQWECGIFINSIQHYIFPLKVLNQMGNDSINDGVSVYKYNQNDALLYGFEAAYDVHPHPFDHIHMHQSFAFVRGVFYNSTVEENMPFIPAARLLTEIKFQLPDFKMFKQNFIRLDNDYNFSQNNFLAENHTETATPSYNLYHIVAGSDWHNKKHKKVASFLFSINNVFDITYQNHLSRLKYLAANNAQAYTGVYAMGRNISLKMIFYF